MFPSTSSFYAEATKITPELCWLKLLKNMRKGLSDITNKPYPNSSSTSSLSTKENEKTTNDEYKCSDCVDSPCHVIQFEEIFEKSEEGTWKRTRKRGMRFTITIALCETELQENEVNEKCLVVSWRKSGLCTQSARALLGLVFLFLYFFLLLCRIWGVMLSFRF